MTTKTHRKIKKRVKKQIYKLENVFDKKVCMINIKDFLRYNTNEVNRLYKPLIKKALNRRQLGDLATEDVLNTMIKEENIQKIKWRIELKLSALDLNNKKLGELTKTSGTLMELREKLRKGIWRGAYIDYDLDLGDKYLFRSLNKGNINRVEVKVILRT